MRPLVGLLAVLALVPATQAGKIEVKGVHLCCPMCVKSATESLDKVAGVAEVKVDEKAKTITFTTKDLMTTLKAMTALSRAGFSGAATDDGNPLMVKLVGGPKAGDKADQVTVRNVHVCCKQCQEAIDALFKDAKVTYSGNGPTKDITISGKELEKLAVLETLQKAGLTGFVK